MAFALVVDDTTLVLLLVIIILLSVSIFVSKAYQPLVHPLLLSRQADVSPVRHKGQSSVYRNANSPAGFDLALQPRRSINSTADILKHGSGANDWDFDTKRNLYGVEQSNKDVYTKARRFGQGLTKLISLQGSSSLAIGVCVESDSASSLEVILSGDVQASSLSNRYTPLIVAPAHLKSGDIPDKLPGNIASNALHALFTTLPAMEIARSMPIVNESTVFIFATSEEVQKAKSQISNPVVVFEDILYRSVPVDQEIQEINENSRQEAAKVHSIFWTGKPGWVQVTNASLVAGLSVHLGFYPVDSYPEKSDHIFVEQSPPFDSSSFRLAAAATPFGLVISLLALYCGASISASSISSSVEDPNPAVSSDFADANATILYTSPSGASLLAACLCTVSKRSPIAFLGAHGKLAALRHGVFSRLSLWDSLLFDKTRKNTRTELLRSVMLISEGPTVGQGLLDILRLQLGCVVRLAYLPAGVLRVLGSDLSTGVNPGHNAGSPLTAVPTAPLTATHSLDLQAFASRPKDHRQVPAHVGPPNVAIELKLVEVDSTKQEYMSQTNPITESGCFQDPVGEIFIRGTCLAGVPTSNEWCATGEIGTIRSNGTLVVLTDQANSDVIDAPTLLSEYPSAKRTSRIGAAGHATRTLSLLSILGFMMCIAGVDSTGVHTFARRDGSTINETLIETAITSFMTSPRASWEQGIAQSAILETHAGQWSVFAGGKHPPYVSGTGQQSSVDLPPTVNGMASASVMSQDSRGQLCSRITGDELTSDGSALDPASCGEAVLLAAYDAGEIANGRIVQSDGLYMRAASRQLEYLLHDAPKIPSGAISMRNTGLSYWSDGVYMGPPFFALYGLMTNNQTLLQLAYDQVRLYRDALRISSGSAQGLFKHIVNATSSDGLNNDPGAWLTGNGWSAAGMSRVLAAISQSQYRPQMQKQINDLSNWTIEIIRAAMNQSYPLLRNYINDTSSFFDTGGSAFIAYATFRIASMVPSADLEKEVTQAERIYQTTSQSLTASGNLRSGFFAVNQLDFSSQANRSPESMAFIVLLSAARRDYFSGNVTGTAGPGSGYDSATTLNLKGNWRTMVLFCLIVGFYTIS